MLERLAPALGIALVSARVCSKLKIKARKVETQKLIAEKRVNVVL